MSQVTDGLTDNGLGKGVTTHYKFSYDGTAFPQATDAANGRDRCNDLMKVVEADFNLMQSWFVGVDIRTLYSFPIAVQITQFQGPATPGGPNVRSYGGAWGPPPVPITLTSPNGAPVQFPQYLLVDEVTEIFMEAQKNGWGFSNGVGNEGSDGEGLSRFLGVQALINDKQSLSVLDQSSSVGLTWWAAQTWLRTTDRFDYIGSNPTPGDNADDKVNGCTTMFAYYLYTQLGFAIPEIVIHKGIGKTMVSTYNQLTLDLGDPFPFFARLIASVYPPPSPGLPGPNQDNPFPLGILTFWGVRSTFGLNDVQDVIKTATPSGRVSPAFTLVIEGLSQYVYQNYISANPATTVFNFSGGLLTAGNGIQISPTPANPGGVAPVTPIAQYEDDSNLREPQRISFTYDITFSNTSAFPGVGGTNTFDLNAQVQFGSTSLTGASNSEEFELFGGDDPYFSNRGPSNGAQRSYLSQELRVFSVAAGTAPLPNGPKFTSDGYASIQSLIGYLKGSSTYTTPSNPDPLDNLPGQQSFETVDSTLHPKDSNGNTLYSFAIARVRMTASTSAPPANSVRVFFRLWTAQSTDTDWQPNVGPYQSITNAPGTPNAGDPIFPQQSGSLFDPSGATLQTIPFFATDAAGINDYNFGVPNGNIQNISTSSSDSVWTYYGCFLDVYSNYQSKFPGNHHCLVAQIAYDGAPIPTSTPAGQTPTPMNWDKLAQRNLQITNSENPKSLPTHVIPQAFDLRASKTLPLTPTNTYLDVPDELMIHWGNTPVGSIASFYWPQLDSSSVLALAKKFYSSHLLFATDANTVQCVVPKGVTYIPIPPAGDNVNYAGLLTINLPKTVRKGQQFNVTVERYSTRSFTDVLIEGPPRASGQPLIKSATKTLPPLLTSGTSPEETPVPSSTKATTSVDLSNTRIWRQAVGAFQIKIPVTTADVMLPAEANTLAVFKWRLENMDPIYRWYPVLVRYTELVAARVNGLGGLASAIPPSLGWAPPGVYGGGKGDCEKTGRVCEVSYSGSAEFEGFKLLTKEKEELRFRGTKRELEELVRRAWEHQWVICVIFNDATQEWPVKVVLRTPEKHHGLKIF